MIAKLINNFSRQRSKLDVAGFDDQQVAFKAFQHREERANFRRQLMLFCAGGAISALIFVVLAQVLWSWSRVHNVNLGVQPAPPSAANSDDFVRAVQVVVGVWRESFEEGMKQGSKSMQSTPAEKPGIQEPARPKMPSPTVEQLPTPAPPAIGIVTPRLPATGAVEPRQVSAKPLDMNRVVDIALSNRFPILMDTTTGIMEIVPSRMTVISPEPTPNPTPGKVPSTSVTQSVWSQPNPIASPSGPTYYWTPRPSSTWSDNSSAKVAKAQKGDFTPAFYDLTGIWAAPNVQGVGTIMWEFEFHQDTIDERRAALNGFCVSYTLNSPENSASDDAITGSYDIDRGIVTINVVPRVSSGSLNWCGTTTSWKVEDANTLRLISIECGHGKGAHVQGEVIGRRELKTASVWR